jgi:hypothetical protein
VQQLRKVAGRQINGISIKVRHGLNGKMYLSDITLMDIQYIKECVEAQLGIENIDLDMFICGGQMVGIRNGMRDMLGLVIGLVGIDVINT